MLASPSSNPRASELRALRLEHLRRLEQRAESLLDFIPRVSPHLLSPRHLAPIARLFHRIAAGERVRACVSVPSQHGKSTLLLHAIPWLLRRRPAWPIAYATFSQEQANDQSIVAKRVADDAGLTGGAVRATMQHWYTPEGGGGFFTGVGGRLTGNPASLVIVDDEPRVDAYPEHVSRRLWAGYHFTPLDLATP